MDATETRILAVRTIGPDAVAVDLESPSGFAAKPGQFLRVSADLPEKEEARFYTISSPDVDDRIEVTVEIDPDGTLGPWLAAREEGDTVTIQGPYGQEYYDGERRVLVLAGGPGVGPAVGIAEAALRDGNEVAVVYVDDEPMHEDRLADASAGGASVAVLGDADALVPAVRDVLREDQQTFIYGFADFIDAAVSALETAGGDSGAAKIENFG